MKLKVKYHYRISNFKRKFVCISSECEALPKPVEQIEIQAYSSAAFSVTKICQIVAQIIDDGASTAVG